MNIIFVLIPLSLVLLVFAVWAFFWAVRTRQFENLDVEAWRILMDDDAPADKPQQDPATDVRSGDAQAGKDVPSGDAQSGDAPAIDPALTQPRRPGSKRR